MCSWAARHTKRMKKERSVWNKNWKKWAAGLVTGGCNGLFGGGGGMVAVPLLQKVCGMDTPSAHASAISIILPLSAVTGAVYALQGAVDWHAFAFVAPALTVGSVGGAFLTGKLKSAWLDNIFTVMMFLAGAWMAFA